MWEQVYPSKGQDLELIGRGNPILIIPCHPILRPSTPGMTRVIAMCYVNWWYTEIKWKDFIYIPRPEDLENLERERERERDHIVLSGLSHCYCHNLWPKTTLTTFFFFFSNPIFSPQPRLPTNYFFTGKLFHRFLFNFSLLKRICVGSGELLFCLPFDLTHQCRSDLSLDFWFRISSGFLIFIFVANSSLLLNFWNILIFFLFPTIRHLSLYPQSYDPSKSSSSFNNGVQRESPVRPGLCFLQLDRSSCQLRPFDQRRLGRRFPYASILSILAC